MVSRSNKVSWLRGYVVTYILDICRGHCGHCPWRIFLSCGEILDVEKFLHVEKLYMWRNLFNFMSWHARAVSSAMSSQVNWSYNSHCFAVRYLFDGIYAVLSKNLFCCDTRYLVAKLVLSRFTHFLCGDKLCTKCCPWRKNDKYHVCV